MDFKTTDKIIVASRKRPKRTILILCLMALIGLSAMFLSGYLSELGKKAPSDSGAEKKVSPGIQIGEIKTGDQGQVFVGSQVTISYVPQEVLQRLLKNLEEKDVAIEERDAKLQELAEKYKELEERLAKRSIEDDLVAQAKQKLDGGDLEGSEHLLLRSIEKNLQAIVEKKKDAASDAFDLGSLRELQLDYAGAKNFFEQSVQLEPDNSHYLNGLGFILYKLGNYKKANDNYKKALAIDLKAFGEQHPHTQTVKSNLEILKKDKSSSKNALFGPLATLEACEFSVISSNYVFSHMSGLRPDRAVP